MRLSSLLAYAATVTASASAHCSGESVTEFDLYGAGYYYNDEGCGAGTTNGTILVHHVGCESDALYPAISDPGNGPEKCKSLNRTDGGSYIPTKLRDHCYLTLYEYDDCQGAGSISAHSDVGKCKIADPGFWVGDVPFRSWKLICDTV